MRILFFNMPMYSIGRPSIQIGLLKSILRENHFDVDDLYLNIDYANYIGVDLYDQMSNFCDILIGDWLFSADYFCNYDSIKYLQYYKSRFQAFFPQYKKNYPQLIKVLTNIREKRTSEWLNSVVNKYQIDSYDIVCFSNTFSQTLPSLAIANRIKKLNPKIITIMGGTALDGEAGIEISKHTSEIDCLVQSYGEEAILEILKIVNSTDNIPKIYKPKKQVNMNSGPIPDYDNYYQMLGNLGKNDIADEDLGGIPIEFSRGCWWGEKQHCIFCGLNADTMSFVSKNEKKIFKELDKLSFKYKRYDFEGVDNILGKQYFSKLLPELIKRNTSYRFFFEVKSNITYNEIIQLKSAGFVALQPGIESLNSEILKIMKKGVSATQNIQLLRWGQEFGIEIMWNILYGFPGETIEQYQQMIKLIPKITHLQPPESVSTIRIDRFSPLFQKYKNIQGKLSPIKAYEFTFPDNWNFFNFAYYFYIHKLTDIQDSIYDELTVVAAKWKKLWNNKKIAPQLKLKKGINFGHIIDTRFGKAEVYELVKEYYQVARYLENNPSSIEKIAKALNYDNLIVSEIISSLEENDIVINLDKNIYLWLPI